MRKLCWGVGAYAVALILAHYVIPQGWLWYCAAIFALAAPAALCFPRGSRARVRALLACLCAAAGFGWYAGYFALYIAPCGALAGQTMTVDAVVTDYPAEGDGYSSVTVRLAEEGLPRVRAQLYDYEGFMTGLRPGDAVAVSVKFSSAVARAGEETDSYISRGIAAKGFMKAAPAAAGRAKAAFLYFPQEIAHSIKLECARVFPEDAFAFMKSLMTGDKTELYQSDALYVALSRAGILHVVAVYGMHLSFLYGFVRLLCRRRAAAAALSIPLLWLFVFVTGATPSAARAAVMLTMVMLAPFLRRETDGVTSLCAAAAPLLLIDPCAIGSASLQLSFAAMAGIILVSPRVYDWCGARWKAPPGGGNRFRPFVIASLSSSLGAVAFSTPIAAMRFGYTAILSPLANLLSLWAVSACFLGGYAAVLLGAAWLPAGRAAGWLVSWASRYVILVCRGVSAVPFAVVYTSERLGAAWLVFVYAAFIAAYLLRGGRPFRPIAPICAGVIALCAVIIVNAYSARGTSMTVLDVGQGQCAVFLSDGGAVVVDCGGDGAGDAAAAYLQSRGVDRVGALVLTHLHSDHAGGVSRLMARMDVDMLLLPDGVNDSDGELPGILESAARRHAEVRYVSGLTTVKSGEMRFTLFPPPDAGEANERGLVALCTVGGWDALITGDVNASAEKRLISAYALPDCEAYIVGHHGSKYSTGEKLLDAIDAETAVISVGYNTYGHPAPEILSRLFERGMDIFRTDINGNVTIRIN